MELLLTREPPQVMLDWIISRARVPVTNLVALLDLIDDYEDDCVAVGIEDALWLAAELRTYAPGYWRKRSGP